MGNARLGPLSQTRRSILESLKRGGPSTIGELAEELGISGEAVRQQIVQLERDGWIRPERRRRDRRGRTGRPAALFVLTPEGDHLFPKGYDRLAVQLLDAVSEKLSKKLYLRVLAALADERVTEWGQSLEGLPLKQSLEGLTAFFGDSNGYARVEKDGRDWRLIARNCPFLNVALERPDLCSVSVNALTRLLGHVVVREERIQSGEGCCTFRVFGDRPVDPGEVMFALEGNGHP